jgi:hypothetical protein
MRAGTYVGPDPQLKGERALLRPARTSAHILAQFDNAESVYGYGWTPFPVEHFDIDPPVVWNEEKKG